MAVATDKFVAYLRDSGLIPSADLDAFLAEHSAERKTDAQQLARELVKQKKLTSYQAQEIYAGRGKKLILGNYVIQDKLGQGGMGMVLKAEHRRMERIVALKVMSKAAVESPDAVKRFHREVKAAAKLTHPNIVTAFDADEAAGTHFLVMEFVEGTDLSQLVKKSGPISVEKGLHCILQAARGLEFAHEHGVVHRDIKPANLLIDAKGNVKILDMGLARIESVGGEQAELTGTGQIMGTVDYMAPEQAMNTRKADARADIYSLGITLWYLLTGRAAYGGETVMEKLMAHQTEPIPSLAEHCQGVSPALEAVFKKMVAKLPGERYQAMSEVIAALERCRSGQQDVAPSIDVATKEEDRLGDFLRGIGGGAPGSGPVVAVSAGLKPAVATPVPGSSTAAQGLDQTIGLPGSLPVVAAPSVAAQSPAGAPAETKPWYADWRLLAAIGGGGSAVVGGLLLVGLYTFGFFGGKPDVAKPLAVKNPISQSPPLAKAPFNSAEARAHQEAWAKLLGVKPKTLNNLGMMMTLIPPGEFEMGSSPEEIAEAKRVTNEKKGDALLFTQNLDAEGPRHKVRLPRPFWISATEITQGQYNQFLAGKGQQPRGGDGDMPAGSMAWDEAVEFCRWLSDLEKKTYRLPTEAEWEYACRAGTTTPFHTGNSLDSNQANFDGNFPWRSTKIGPFHNAPVKVATFPPNAFGLFDMHANQWEWCQDFYDDRYYSNSPTDNPTGPASGTQHVIRGGDWEKSQAVTCRSAQRYAYGSGFASVGFRVVREIGSTTAGPGVDLPTTPPIVAGPAGWIFSDWKPLFDGKSLEGWTGETERFTVENGILASDGMRGIASAPGTFENFEVELEFRLQETGNSGLGIFYSGSGDPAANGMEVQLLDDPAYGNVGASSRCGALYQLTDVEAGHYKPWPEWNTIVARSLGDNLEIVLNGVSIVKTTRAALIEAKPSHQGVRRKSGAICLYPHTARGEYCTLRVREASIRLGGQQ